MDAVTVPSRDHLRRFQFIREIASGGFGSVFLTKVMHADGFSRLVAIKLLKSQWTDSDEVARRMRDEARLLGLLRHRNIVDVIDLSSIDGRAAVIMEYLEAVDLRTVVIDLAASGRRMPVRVGLEAASAVASALDAAYNRPPIPGDKPLRVIHRDIKPSNIMVDDTGMVKVLDFGVARSEIENRESHTQELQFGSVDYMAPERLFFEPETPASDVYSLSATLFEILALENSARPVADRPVMLLM
jgi:serine/threonine-protein kinase